MSTKAPLRRGSVTVFTGHFHPHVGGVERYTRELWSRLAARGWRVTVVTSNTNDAPEVEELFGLRVVRLPVFKLFKDRLPVPTAAPGLWRALRQVDAARADVVVTNTRFFPTSVLGALVARRWRVPLVHIDHGSAHVDLGARWVSAAGEQWDHHVGGWVLAQATRCYGVSQAVADFLVHLGRSGAGVLPNGVDASQFRAPTADFRAQAGIPAGDTVILYVGRLIADKGIMVLLDAYERLGDRPGLHLVVAGDGHMRAEVEARAAKLRRVHVLGQVDGAQVKNLLAAADVFAHPSYYPEGLPTAILEAGAAGLAVVATPMGGTREVIVDDDHGLVVPIQDPAAMAGALESLLAQPERRRRMGDNLRRLVERRFDWEPIADLAEAELLSLAATTA